MVRLVVINNSPLVKVMRPLTPKVRVSPGVALAMAWRSEPGPLSVVVVTRAAHPQVERSIAMTTKANGIDLLIFALRFLVPQCGLKRKLQLRRSGAPEEFSRHCISTGLDPELAVVC